MNTLKNLLRKSIFIILLITFSPSLSYAGPATEAALLLAFASFKAENPINCLSNMNSLCTFDHTITAVGQEFNKISADRNCALDFTKTTDTYPGGITCYPISCTITMFFSAEKSGLNGITVGDYCVQPNGDVFMTENGHFDGGTNKLNNARGLLRLEGTKKSSASLGIVKLDYVIINPK